MKKLLPLALTLAVWVQPAMAGPAVLTSLKAVHVLTNNEAMQKIPAAFEATVTYYRNSGGDLFVQDGDSAIYAYYRPGASLAAGDRVLVHGVTGGSFRPFVMADSVTVLGHGDLPRAEPVNVEQLFSSQRDCEYVSIRGTVRSAEMVWVDRRQNILLQVLMDGGYVDAAVNSQDADAINHWLDAEVEITGVVNAKFNRKMEQWGTVIDVQNLNGVKVLGTAKSDPTALPLTSIEDLLGAYNVRDLSQRIRVRGTITYFQPGAAAVLQSGNRSVWITTVSFNSLRVGDEAEATGFPEIRDGYVALNHGQIRDMQVWDPVKPLSVSELDLGTGPNAFKLVSAVGWVVSEAREAAKDEYVLTANGHLFSAIYNHPKAPGEGNLVPMKELRIGAKVQVTGISMVYSSDPSSGPVASDLLLRSFDDIAEIAPPSWLTITNLLWILGDVLLILFLSASWVWGLERRVRRQSELIAARREAEIAMEKRRSKLLEDINGNVPLPRILQEITDLVSARVGAPCWFEIMDGSTAGEKPVADGHVVVSEQMQARSGEPLGRILIAFGSDGDPIREYSDALSMGARVATLALETRRLYSDLLRRSEFDMLTDIHNRFSLEKHLDALTSRATQNAEMFGLIYIDLDEFKRVNDRHGHQIGDTYLQQVAMRMKRQLRSHDVLARIGGDEFAAVISKIARREEIDFVVQRIQQCLADPIVLDGLRLPVSVSCGVAVFPEDGLTRDSLLHSADVSMYTEKQKKHPVGAGAIRP